MEDVVEINHLKHKIGIHVFKYKINLLEIRGGALENAFIKMVNNATKDFPEGRIQVTPLHDQLSFKHINWPITTYNNIVQSFFDKMEKIINHGEELILDEVIFEVIIIPNKDSK